MFPPFPVEEALSVCQKIIHGLENGSLKMEQTGAVSEERNGQGIMIGAAVCRDSSGRSVVLNTVSGISKRLYVPECTFVEPVVSASEIEKALSKNDLKIHILTDQIKKLKESRKRPDGRYENQGDEEKSLVEERSKLCRESLENVYGLYSFYCIDGKCRTLNEICQGKLPPTGTGDCCAPKLLNYAFKNGLRVVSMAEVFYGKDTETKKNGVSYGPCDERCKLILPSILGLEILYRDSDIVVVNKQSGLLSVPGRGPEKQDCIVNRLKRIFPDCINQPSVHRLDMETSGLLVLALTEDAHRNLNRQFEMKEVSKKYVAVIDGKLPERFEKHGTMELYFRVDLDNRPHQMWDEVYGKKAVTEWNWMGEEAYTSPEGKKRTVTRMEFIPHTGRTHQLRLASADEHGFGVPIIGDTLYGKCEAGERLLLHAEYLKFTHPVTGEKMEFFCKAPF